MPGNFNSPQIDFAGGLNAIGDNLVQGIQKYRLQNALSGGVPMMGGVPDWSALTAKLTAAGRPDLAVQVAEKIPTPEWKVNPFTGGTYNANSSINPQGQAPSGPANQPIITPAQRAEDAAFAKTIPEWQSGGRAEEVQSLSALAEARGNLGAQYAGQHPEKAVPFPNDPSKAVPGIPYKTPDGKLGSWDGTKFVSADEVGTVSGAVPGLTGWVGRNVPFGGMGDYAAMGELVKKNPGYAATNYPAAVSTMQAHVRAVAGGLKAILGGQRSQAISQRIIDATFNGDLPPEENLARLNRLNDNIQAAGNAREAQIKWYKEHNGSLVGYTGPDPEKMVDSAVTEFGSTPSQQQYQEGQTATNPQTGAKVIFKAGQWTPLQ